MTASSLATVVAIAAALVLQCATAIAPAFFASSPASSSSSSAVATTARGVGGGRSFPPPSLLRRRRRRRSSGPSSSSASAPLAARGGGGGDDDASDDDGPPVRRRRRRTVLVTGGAGYIGSHTCLELLATGRYRVVVVDNLVNSDAESLNRVRELLASSVAGGGAEKQKNDGDDDDDDDDDDEMEEGRLHFRNCDIRDGPGLKAILDEFPSIGSCVHFAGLKAVGESFSRPLDYYDVNVGGTTTLLRRLEDASVNRFVFSSSATVYGEPEVLPLTEDARLSATNPYGRTKLFIEEMLRDVCASDPTRWSVLILRYFNPIGAHPSGRMGEDPQGIPNNLMPFIAQVCVGRREKLGIFGNDYDTPDGTGVRDYIHVVDLAKGHVAALDRLYNDDPSTSSSSSSPVPVPAVGCESVNLGTGRGVSVLELVAGMADATGRPVPYAISDRRPGDVAQLYADATKAREMLGWEAELGTREMCEDTWRWQSTNPMGYKAEVVPAVAEEEVVVATAEN